MAKKQNTYYQYISDRIDTTCGDCKTNDGMIFSEKYAPILPVHPNCRCKLNKIKYYTDEIPDLSQFMYSEWYITPNGNFV